MKTVRNYADMLVKLQGGPFDGHEQEASEHWNAERIVVAGEVYHRIPCRLLGYGIARFTHMGRTNRCEAARNHWSRTARWAWKVNCKINALAGLISVHWGWRRPFFIRWANWLLAKIWYPSYSESHGKR